ncbi:hypothetical protein IFM89_028264 [Coptis chinensis]|uniref:Uncharacterized protein n=1 Tax=Coptis chinensis TaxID=261450 RepID=A0A835HDQ3_9MAGN|nr:hypothetical protein IFM89_028264 [Coptis chinensis]
MSVARMVRTWNIFSGIVFLQKNLWKWVAGHFSFTCNFQNMQEAVDRGKRCSSYVKHLWLSAVVGGMAFGTGKLPWWLTQRWENIKGKVVNCIFTTTWREANFSADLAANKATTMPSTQTYLFEGRLAWIFKLESPHLAYFRFVN